MDLTTDILDEIWEIADLTEEVTYFAYSAAADGLDDSVTVLALKRVRDDAEGAVGEDAQSPVRHRRFHLRAKDTSGAAWGPPVPRGSIVYVGDVWAIVSVASAAHNTRYVCECVRSY